MIDYWSEENADKTPDEKAAHKAASKTGELETSFGAVFSEANLIESIVEDLKNLLATTPPQTSNTFADALQTLRKLDKHYPLTESRLLSDSLRSCPDIESFLRVHSAFVKDVTWYTSGNHEIRELFSTLSVNCLVTVFNHSLIGAEPQVLKPLIESAVAIFESKDTLSDPLVGSTLGSWLKALTQPNPEASLTPDISWTSMVVLAFLDRPHSAVVKCAVNIAQQENCVDEQERILVLKNFIQTALSPSKELIEIAKWYVEGIPQQKWGDIIDLLLSNGNIAFLECFSDSEFHSTNITDLLMSSVTEQRTSRYKGLITMGADPFLADPISDKHESAIITGARQFDSLLIEQSSSLLQMTAIQKETVTAAITEALQTVHSLSPHHSKLRNFVKIALDYHYINEDFLKETLSALTGKTTTQNLFGILAGIADHKGITILEYSLTSQEASSALYEISPFLSNIDSRAYSTATIEEVFQKAFLQHDIHTCAALYRSGHKLPSIVLENLKDSSIDDSFLTKLVGFLEPDASNIEQQFTNLFYNDRSKEFTISILCAFHDRGSSLRAILEKSTDQGVDSDVVDLLQSGIVPANAIFDSSSNEFDADSLKASSLLKSIFKKEMYRSQLLLGQLFLEPAQQDILLTLAILNRSTESVNRGMERKIGVPRLSESEILKLVHDGGNEHYRPILQKTLSHSSFKSLSEDFKLQIFKEALNSAEVEVGGIVYDSLFASATAKTAAPLLEIIESLPLDDASKERRLCALVFRGLPPPSIPRKNENFLGSKLSRYYDLLALLNNLTSHEQLSSFLSTSTKKIQKNGFIKGEQWDQQPFIQHCRQVAFIVASLNSKSLGNSVSIFKKIIQNDIERVETTNGLSWARYLTQLKEHMAHAEHIDKMFYTLTSHIALPRAAYTRTFSQMVQRELDALHSEVNEKVLLLLTEPVISRELLIYHADFKRPIARPDLARMRQVDPRKEVLAPVNTTDEWFPLFTRQSLPGTDFEIRCLTQAKELLAEGKKSRWCYGTSSHSSYLDDCRSGVRHILVITKAGENKASIDLKQTRSGEGAIPQEEKFWKVNQFLAPDNQQPSNETRAFWEQILPKLRQRLIPTNKFLGINPEHPLNQGYTIAISAFEQLTGFSPLEISALHHQLVAHYSNRVQVQRGSKTCSIIDEEGQKKLWRELSFMLQSET